MRRFVKEISLLMGWLLVLVVLKTFVITPVQVDGSSMNQTLKNQDRGFIYKLSPIQRYDIVVFNTVLEGNETQFIKRVIGLPGETIVSREQDIYIDGERLMVDVPLRGVELTGDFTYIIPKDHYFVLGDNRGDSTDSRVIGSISKESIVGKFIFRFAPYQNMESF